MHKFFIPLHQLADNQAILQGEDSRHLAKSLRMKAGDELLLSTQEGIEYWGKIVAINEDMVQVVVLDSWPDKSESSLEITLYQALPKGDKLDFIVQKATELGVHTVIPVLTQFCVSRPKEKAMKGKIQRWERIALEAAKQSRRGRVPEVLPLKTFKEGLAHLAQQDTPLLYYEKGTQALGDFLPLGKKVGVFIGSEGGFAPQEIQEAQEMGIFILQLGQRILRCETAPLVALTTLLYAQGEL